MLINLFKWLVKQRIVICSVCRRPCITKERYTINKKVYRLCIDCLCHVAGFECCLDRRLHPKKTHEKYQREARAYLRKIEQQGNSQALELLKEIQVSQGVKL